MIGKLREYLKKCPCFEDMKEIGVDFLSDDVNIASIEKTPIKPILNEKIYDIKKKQASFTLRVKLVHSNELKTQIENSDFLEDLEDWLEEQNDNKDFPELKKGKTVTKIYVSSSGYLYGFEPSLRLAVYQIQIVMEYEKRNCTDPFADFLN